MAKTSPLPTRNLSDAKRFLLQTLPGRYQLPNRPRLPIPRSVVIARRLVAAYDAQQRRLDESHTKRLTGLLDQVKEAIYFQSEEAALKAFKKAMKIVGSRRA